MSTQSGARPAIKSHLIAPFLSFLWPGLGQWYNGARRLAVVFALPVAIVFLVVAIQALGGAQDLVLQMVTPSTAMTVAILIGLLGLWRLIAMVEALGSAYPRGRWRGPVPLAAFMALALVVVGTHVVGAGLAWSLYGFSEQVFVGEVRPDGGSYAAEESDDPNVLPVATPAVTPKTAESRINVLLVGIDSSPTRNHALTDTLMVVSVDPVSGSVAMISFPRDIGRFPLSGGGTYRGKVNSLMTYAKNHPGQFPDGGMPTLTKELGFLLGVPIHYYAAVNLAGFEKVIDLVGGVEVDNQKAINDPSYGGWHAKKVGFKLSKGKHLLNGERALAYVRSRMSPGDTDFGRARRQQQLLVALARKLTDPTMLPRVPSLLDGAADAIRTNFPSDRLAEMMRIAERIDEDAIERVILKDPYSNRPKDSGEYVLVPDMARWAKLSIKLFGSDSRYATAASEEAPSAKP